MAKIEYLLQGISTNSHIELIDNILSIPNIQKVVFSVAFMKNKGLRLIENHLKRHYSTTEIYVGIRNGVTSVQAILHLVKNGISTYLVDTGTNSYIFHPKIFLAYSDNEAKIIIGSANATSGGFSNNIEASTLLHLDTKIGDDKELLDKILNSLSDLKMQYPSNVTNVTTVREVVKIFQQGLLSDERVSSYPSTSLKSISKRPESVPRMKLKTHKPSRNSIIITKSKKITPVQKTHGWRLLWESGPLNERDLNIPSGSNTNPTGSMYFKKGNIANIDQRHYFRDTVFNNLIWENDTAPKKAHYERTHTDFEIIIKGIYYGIHNLKLSHNTKTNTRTYLQNNSVTQIHWGTTKQIIARTDLLGEVLRIYKPQNKSSYFILEIK